MVNREILHKFFRGESTTSEEIEIRYWLEADDNNMHLFLAERKIYDSILFNKSTTEDSRNVTNKVSLLNKVIRVAAIFLLLSTIGLLINRYYEEKSATTELHTLVVPPGQRTHLVLADNTSIWLNANTTFKYPAKFSKKQRNVFLDGEAYLDVSANENHPFVVNTPHGGLKVTGTTFNVSAYSKYNKFETSLFEGKVSVYMENNDEIVNIKPTQKTVIKNGKLKVEKIEDYDEFLWRKGLIAFNNKKLNEILAVLEQYFDTKIEVMADSLPDNTYTGKFRQADGIDYALRVLQKSINFTYERDNERQIIYIKNN